MKTAATKLSPINAEHFVQDYPECSNLNDVNWSKFADWQRRRAKSGATRAETAARFGEGPLNFSIGAHRTSEARAFLGLGWVNAK